MYFIEEDILKILITNEEITNRCIELAREIEKDYEDKNPILVCLLKGSLPFLAKMLEHIRIPLEIDCIKVHSKKDKVIFLTARSDFDNKELFLKTFRDNGIDVDIPNVHVERSGNLKHIKGVADRKKHVILNYLKSGEYTAVRMFDDDKTNLETFRELGEEINSGKYGILNDVRKKYPRVRKLFFFPLMVLPDGKTRMYN